MEPIAVGSLVILLLWIAFIVYFINKWGKTLVFDGRPFTRNGTIYIKQLREHRKITRNSGIHWSLHS